MARYTYSPGYIDAVAVQERDLNSDDDFGDDDEVVYFHGNTLHSTYCLTDDGESVVERYRYDAYGGCTVLDADGSDDSDNASDVENPFLFTGRRLDSEWGGVQYRHRSYSTVLGRFVSRDPAESEPGYSYVGDAPTALVDPEGLQCMCCCADKVEITDVRPFWDQTKKFCGHEVHIGITYTNVELTEASEGSESTQCTLEYWEKTNVKSDSVPDAPVDQWYDAHAKTSPEDLFWKPWEDRDVHTPGERTVELRDVPNLGTDLARHRDLFFAIILRSGKACPQCSKQEAVVYATQRIKVVHRVSWLAQLLGLQEKEGWFEPFVTLNFFEKGKIPPAQLAALEAARQSAEEQ